MGYHMKLWQLSACMLFPTDVAQLDWFNIKTHMGSLHQPIYYTDAIIDSFMVDYGTLHEIITVN